MIKTQIVEIIEKIRNIKTDSSGVSFVYGDESLNLSVMHKSGIPRVLAGAYNQQMDEDDEFRDIILATVSAYLLANPEKMEEFLFNLDLNSDCPLNMN